MSDPSNLIGRLNTALEGRYRIEREIGEGRNPGKGPDPARKIETLVHTRSAQRRIHVR